MTSSSVRRSGSCRKLSSIPPRVQSRCVRSFRVSCFNWCCNAFSSLMAFRSFFSLFSNSRLSFSSFEVSGKGSVLLSRYQHINSIRFSHALTHPHDKSGGFQFIQRTLDRHGTAAMAVTGKQANRIPFSSSCPLESIASNIRQYITFAVLLTGNPVNALGKGIQGGNGVSIVINSKFILCVPPFSLLVWISNGGSQPQSPGSSACTHAGISGTIRCK